MWSCKPNNPFLPQSAFGCGVYHRSRKQHRTEVLGKWQNEQIEYGSRLTGKKEKKKKKKVCQGPSPCQGFRI